MCAASPPKKADNNPILHVNSPPVEGSRSAESGSHHREAVFSKGVVHGCLPEQVGGSV